jgi:hypothetical protein
MDAKGRLTSEAKRASPQRKVSASVARTPQRKIVAVKTPQRTVIAARTPQRRTLAVARLHPVIPVRRTSQRAPSPAPRSIQRSPPRAPQRAPQRAPSPAPRYLN